MTAINWDVIHQEMYKQLQLQQDRKILRELKLSKYAPRNIIEYIYILALKENHKLYDEYEGDTYVVNAYEDYPGDYKYCW